LRLYEYQAKRIFADHGIKVPKGKTASSPLEVYEIVKEFGGPAIIKAQVLVGGRGLAGGIKLAQDADQAKEIANQLIGGNIKNEDIHTVLVEENVSIKRELFAGALIDYSTKSPVLIASREGGVDIESIAIEHPQDISKEKVDANLGLTDFMTRRIAKKIGLQGRSILSFGSILKSIYNILRKYDATLVEVNPLAFTTEGEFIALDAKITLDDNAQYKHRELFSNIKSERPIPSKGAKYRKHLIEKAEIPTYIELDGNLSIIADGAGTGMLTLDLTKDYGGKIESYCELGGRVTPQLIEEAMKIVLSNKRVKVLLINLIGGLNRMDEMAQGITSFIAKRGSEEEIEQEIVVRMSGTLEEEGRKILKRDGISSFDNIYDAIENAVQLSRRS
jgi:succinyl-CoA synthetase beta subunit